VWLSELRLYYCPARQLVNHDDYREMVVYRAAVKGVIEHSRVVVLSGRSRVLALMGSGGRDAGVAARAGVWASVGVACAMLVLLGGCAARTSRSGGPVRATTATASQSLSLSALSCFSSSACTAIGSISAGSSRRSVAERWNGSSWSAQLVPTPADQDLLSVSCPSLTVCFAVGYASVLGTDSSLRDYVPLVERWAGGRWSMQSTPRIPAPTLLDVSCASPDACTAIGHSGLPSSHSARPLVERWDGMRWSIQRAAGNADAVSCPSTRGCIAVGIDLSGSGFAAAERWSGARWSRRRIPSSNSHPFHDLNISDLSCSSMSACIAVGFWAECAGSPQVCPLHGLAWLRNGSRWSVHSVSGGGYDTVSCVSPHWCVGAAPRQLSLWNGKRWSTTFKLTGRGQTFTDVSCTSVNACIAVSDNGKVAEQWDGRSWNSIAPPATAPAPANP